MAVSYKGIENLRNAIILQAVKDLKRAYRKLKRNPDSVQLKTAAEYEERFFSSKWYKTLTTINGSMVVAHVREEAGL